MGSVNHSYQKQWLAVVIQRELCLCYGISQSLIPKSVVIQRELCLCYGISQSLIPKAVVGSGDSKRTLPLLWDQSITDTKSSGWQWWFKENSASVMGSVNHSYQKQLLAVVIQRGLCLCYGISQSLIPKAVVGSGDSKRTLPLLWDQSITHTKSSGWQW